MEWLNYHHLYYFWVVARAGGLAPAARELRLAPSTLSGQIRKLEDALGRQLFDRSGRRLRLTDIGQTTFDYAHDIFRLGRELQLALKSDDPGRAAVLRVGVANAVPKLVTRMLLEDVLRAHPHVQLVCHEDRPDRLLAELALHHLDVVISDAPRPAHLGVKAHDHLIGESDVVLFGHRDVVARLPDAEGSRRYDGVPFLLPSYDTSMRGALDHWFQRHGVSPRVVAEVDDSALLKALGAAGLGLFPLPSVMREAILRDPNLEVAAKVDGVFDRFYLISEERRLRQPAIIAIAEAGRARLFTSEKQTLSQKNFAPDE